MVKAKRQKWSSLSSGREGVTLGKSPSACPILLGRVPLKHPARDEGGTLR